jgi:hypothetical protein
MAAAVREGVAGATAVAAAAEVATADSSARAEARLEKSANRNMPIGRVTPDQRSNRLK